jgi:hypothetical protein
MWRSGAGRLTFPAARAPLRLMPLLRDGGERGRQPGRLGKCHYGSFSKPSTSRRRTASFVSTTSQTSRSSTWAYPWIRMLRKAVMRRCSLIRVASVASRLEGRQAAKMSTFVWSTDSRKYGFLMAEATTRSVGRSNNASRASSRPK